MTLTNYWWLLIWLFTGGLALAAYFPKHREMVCGKVEIRWGVVPAVLMAVPYIVWAGYRSDAFGDTAAYRGAFTEAPSSFSEVSAYLDTITKDKGFYGLVAALKSLFHVSDIGCFYVTCRFSVIGHCLAVQEIFFILLVQLFSFYCINGLYVMGAEWSPAVSGSNDCFTGNSVYVEEKVYSGNPFDHTCLNYASVGFTHDSVNDHSAGKTMEQENDFVPASGIGSNPLCWKIYQFT